MGFKDSVQFNPDSRLRSLNPTPECFQFSQWNVKKQKWGKCKLTSSRRKWVEALPPFLAPPLYYEKAIRMNYSISSTKDPVFHLIGFIFTSLSSNWIIIIIMIVVMLLLLLLRVCLLFFMCLSLNWNKAEWLLVYPVLLNIELKLITALVWSVTCSSGTEQALIIIILIINDNAQVY